MSRDPNGHIEPLTQDDIRGAVERLRESKALGATPSQALVPASEDRHSLSIPDDLGDRLPAPYANTQEAQQLLQALRTTPPALGGYAPEVWSLPSLPDDWSPLPLAREHLQAIYAWRSRIAQAVEMAQALRYRATDAERGGLPASAISLIERARAIEYEAQNADAQVQIAIRNLAEGLAYDNLRRLVEAAPELANEETAHAFLQWVSQKYPGLALDGASKNDIRQAFAEFARARPASAKRQRRRETRDVMREVSAGPASLRQRAAALGEVLRRRGVTI